MLRKVVDSNYLKKPDLRQYLSASQKNIVVVTDYAELEMLAANNLQNFLKSSEIIAQYPKQVALSRAIDVVANLRGKKKGLKKRFTDGKRTSAFRRWCRLREQIKRGETSFECTLVRAWEDALPHRDRLLEDAANLKDDLGTHAAEHYTSEELHIIRARRPFTRELTNKVIDAIMHFTLEFFRANPNLRKLPPSEELPYTFTFRFALCAYLHALHWIAAGGAKDRKTERFRNDLVDIALAAYGTCFDGLLTHDKLPLEIYDNATFLLKNGFLIPHKRPT